MECRKCRREIPEGSVYCLHCGAKQAAEKRRALKRANGTGTVYKLSGRRSRPWVAAKNKTIIGYYAKKTEALEALNKLAGRTLDERYNMTFAEIFKAWKAEHAPTITPRVQAAYDRSFEVFAPLHARKFRELRTADFQAALEPQMGKKYATVAKHKQLITQLSSWAMREEIITTNFASFVRLPENVKTEKEIFTAEEIAKLEADGSETARVVLMLIYTGMRIGELFALRLEDYHGSYVVGGEKTEAGRNRVIPIRPEGRQYFEHFAEAAYGPLLMSGYGGQHNPNNFRRRDYYPLLDRLGIQRKTPHATRHTYVSWAVSKGLRAEDLQKIVGHADYNTTASIYYHADPDALVKAVEAAAEEAKEAAAEDEEDDAG